jgi:hypothetical protein
VNRALTLGLVLIATAVSATDLQLSTKHTELRALSPSRESLGQKTQWVGPIRKFFSTARTRSFPRGNQKRVASLRACAR